MSYTTLFVTRKATISENNFLITPFLLCSYFRAHPTTLLLKILGGRMHGPSPPQIFGGTVLPVPPRSSPMYLYLTALLHPKVVYPSYHSYFQRALLQIHSH